MPLLDALLLDPCKINVWIAYRTEGVAGSGTQNDPYDGRTDFGLAFSVTASFNVGQEVPASDAATVSRKTGQKNVIRAAFSRRI